MAASSISNLGRGKFISYCTQDYVMADLVRMIVVFRGILSGFG